jgi:hypothetical protein
MNLLCYCFSFYDDLALSEDRILVVFVMNGEMFDIN